MPDTKPHDDLATLTLQHIFHARYKVPIYQRNYDWGASEILPLLYDIHAIENTDYYLGTLVVSPSGHEPTVYEVIDGQQRLTTLCLLLAFLKNERALPRGVQHLEHLPLSYQCRPHFASAFAKFWQGGFSCPEECVKDEENREEASARPLLSAYSLIAQSLPELVKGPPTSTLPDFAAKLLQRVHLFRVALPEGTDLNHYFEVMNNRGEQLEQHEIVKACMLEKLHSCEQATFHTLWEACSQMSTYVQMNFSPLQRRKLFGEDYDSFIGSHQGSHGSSHGDSITKPTLSHYYEAIDAGLKSAAQEEKEKNHGENKAESEASPLCLIAIMQQKSLPEGKPRSSPTEESPDRFSPPIEFPNFLMHVLRLQIGTEKIPLNDDKLIEIFAQHVQSAEEVKAFACNLLRCRSMLDKYVIKRDAAGKSQGWSLKRCSKSATSVSYSDTFSKGAEETAEETKRAQKQILMLLSAFHVSVSTQAYKYWLNGVLHYLMQKESIDAGAYLAHLKGLANAFVFGHFLPFQGEEQEDGEGQGLTYQQIIYEGKRVTASHKPEKQFLMKQHLMEQLQYQKHIHAFIFTYLDYLLWESNKHERATKDFRFTFRESVEHHYPQHPKVNSAPLDPEFLHSFGNLCLVSHRANASLGNNMPAAKNANFGPDKFKYSIKQGLMLTQSDNWDAAAIKKHGEEMVEMLLKALPLP